MPWKETSAVEERYRFIADLESDLYTMTELCAQYGVSRQTGYTWARRYGEEGWDGLKDRSRAPKSCPHRTDEATVAALVRLRGQHPDWGPKKLRRWLAQRDPGRAWPAPSTIGDLLTRHGLVVPRRRPRRRAPSPGRSRFPAAHPNDLWSGDYKGEFRTGDRHCCYPLTVLDSCTRYLLGCQSRRSTAHQQARPVFRRLFEQFGLPREILSDCGVPFATAGLARLSRLAVWWIRLGIRPLLIQPGHPEQNGRHERLHKTLKAATARPPAQSLPAQQRRFDHFRNEYNHERPHEALGQKTPAELYAPSPRPYPKRLPPVHYPGHFEVRRVGSNGCLRWRNHFVFVTHVLAHEDVGLEEIDNGIWALSFGPLLLARFDERNGHLREVHARSWHPR